LRKDGTCWVNLGDTYASSGGASRHFGYQDPKYKNGRAGNYIEPSAFEQSVQPKSLCLIPQCFAIEMVNRGWILRNTIIWHKPNCMPSSAKDRFTVDFEYFYFFTKSNKTQFWTNNKTDDCVRKQPLGTKGIEGKDWEYNKNGKKKSLWTGHDYYFEQQFEPMKESTIKRAKSPYYGNKTKNGGYAIDAKSVQKQYDKINELGITTRNKRAVWKIPTKPFPEAHFAVFPEALIETPIKAGCPKYVCKKCGKARVKILDYSDKVNAQWGKRKSNPQGFRDKREMPQKVIKNVNVKEIGYTDCGCNAGFEGGVVLDPFIGSGTTARVALKQGKRYLGIEIKQEYIDIANKRIRKIPETLF